MGVLTEAKKGESKKEEPKKHKKHPATKTPSPAESEPDSEGSGEGGADQEETDTDADESAPDAQGEAAQPAGDSPQGPQDEQGGDSDQGAPDSDQDADQEQQGQGGGQGATPVPNPAAPGAGDDTSGGDDTPDSSQGPETPGEDTAAGPGSTNSLPQVPMSPGLQEEYQHANDALMQALYSMPGDTLATAVLKSLWPQGPGKIKGVIVSALMVLTQLHKKLKLPPQIILPFTKDVVAHIMDLGQQVKQIQYSDQESTAILGGAYEGAMRIFGVNKGQARNVVQQLGRKQLAAHAQIYQKARAHAKGAIDQNNQQWHLPHLAPGAGPSGGTPGPQSGAPAGAQTPASTPPGAPQGAPPPAAPAAPASGGMMAQAATQGGENG